MAHELTIARIAKPPATVSVRINIAQSEQPLDFKNKAMVGVRNMDDAVSPDLPYLTFRAIESAFISGAIYARRKLEVTGLSVELLSFSWTGKVENAEPFAVAVTVAACKALSEAISFSANELCGWHLPCEAGLPRQ